MMSVILTTTGISLYNRAKVEFKTGTPTDEQMRQLLRKNPSAVSAEANSLLQIAQPDDYLVFFHTETQPAERCVSLLREFFIERGFKPYQIEVRRLEFQEDESHMETQGLLNLVNCLIAEIDKARDKHQEVIINATAGFKAQAVYSTMIGMIYRVPIKYIYETFQKVVTFTPIDLDWNTGLFLAYEWFFKWVDETMRSQKEVEKLLHDIPSWDRTKIQSMLTPPDKDGEVFLTPMGNAMWKRFKSEAEEAKLIPLPPDAIETDFRKKIAKAILNVGHHFPKGTRAISEKIAKLPWVKHVDDGEFENTKRKGIQAIYDDGRICLLWADDKKAANLIVQTTARGPLETRRVAEEIKKLLENS
jgi:putative CRISPR-associated protein (TIGR02619 family)